MIHRTDPAAGTDVSIGVDRTVGSAVPATDGRLVVAIDDGFRFVDLGTGELEPIAPIPVADGVMMNDGKTDGAGRYWAGTKDTEGRRPLGSLYRLDRDGTVAEVVRGVTISNGLGWSPDGRTMYFIDSATYGIDAFEADPASGAIAGRRRLVDLPRRWGLPDGMTVDAEGFLWVAFWTGSAVRRLDPDGDLVATVALPVSLVTSCTFGGPDLTDLYITSASAWLSEGELQAEPHAGGLFRCGTAVQGLPSVPYRSAGAAGTGRP